MDNIGQVHSGISLKALQKRLPLSLIHMLGLYQTLCIVFYRITPQITLIHLLQKDV